MKNVDTVDTDAITHRKANDCTCYVCTRKETQKFLKEKENVQLQERREESPNKTGRMS